MSGKSEEHATDRDFEQAPVNGLLGARTVDSRPADGWVRVRYLGREDFLNRQGIVQGGLLTAMLDNAMARALRLSMADDIAIMSLEIKTSFLAPAPAGDLYCEGTVVAQGKSTAFVEGRLFAPDGSLCATASSTCRLIPLDIAREQGKRSGSAGGGRA